MLFNCFFSFLFFFADALRSLTGINDRLGWGSASSLSDVTKWSRRSFHPGRFLRSAPVSFSGLRGVNDAFTMVSLH